MNTTSLLVDILIIGIQVLIWLTLFLFSYIIKVDSFDYNNYPLIVFGVIAISYTLGTIFDYTIAWIFELFKGVKEKELYKDVSVIKILSQNKEIQQYLDSQYARLRIARATVFNIPFIIISICCFVSANDLGSNLHNCAIPLIILIGLVLFLLAIHSWCRRNITYKKYIEDTLKIVK